MDCNYVNVVLEWDAGDMGCGELVLLLFQKMQQLSCEDVIKLVATDSGAREDLPAWCGTGHLLLRAEHPQYWIMKKKG